MRNTRLFLVAFAATCLLVAMPTAVARPPADGWATSSPVLLPTSAAAAAPTEPTTPSLPEVSPSTTVPNAPGTTPELPAPPAPENPDLPEIPVTPDTSEKPAIPETPEVPDTPEKPERPTTSKKPETETQLNEANEPAVAPGGSVPPGDGGSSGQGQAGGSGDSNSMPIDKSSLRPQVQLRSTAAIAVAEQANLLRTVHELEPAEGLGVVFTTLVENIALYWQAAVATGAVASLLLWIGVSRDERARFSAAKRLRRLVASRSTSAPSSGN